MANYSYEQAERFIERLQWITFLQKTGETPSEQVQFAIAMMATRYFRHAWQAAVDGVHTGESARHCDERKGTQAEIRWVTEFSGDGSIYCSSRAGAAAIQGLAAPAVLTLYDHDIKGATLLGDPAHQAAFPESAYMTWALARDLGCLARWVCACHLSLQLGQQAS